MSYEYTTVLKVAGTSLWMVGGAGWIMSSSNDYGNP